MRSLEERHAGFETGERGGAEHTQRACEVEQAWRQEAAADGIRDAGNDPACERVVPCSTNAANEVGTVDLREQRRQLGRRTLEIGVERRDERAGRRPEARAQRRRLAAAVRKTHHTQPVVGERQTVEHCARVVGAAIVHDDQLPRETPGIQSVMHLL